MGNKKKDEIKLSPFTYLKPIETIELKKKESIEKYKTYEFILNGSKLTVETPKVFIPNGVEDNNIINIEIDPNNNDCYNFLIFLQEIDDTVKSIEKFKKLEYIPILEKKDDKYLLRTHINRCTIRHRETKQNFIKSKIFFDNLLVKNDTFELMIFIKSIKLS